jgi:membrane associated rhomboid family serine protease
MNSNFKPIFTFIICTLTACVSLYGAFQITGSVFGKSQIIHLADYGGLTIKGLEELEVWRLLTSQLLHVHQKHMIYNVLSILFLGIVLERKVGSAYILFIWLLAGVAGTLFSTQFGSPPWNTGTGASQFALGLAGFGLVLVIRKIEHRYLLASALVFALVPALYLDLKAAGYPKPGHVLSFIIGCCMALYYLYNTKSLTQQRS